MLKKVTYFGCILIYTDINQKGDYLKDRGNIPMFINRNPV